MGSCCKLTSYKRLPPLHLPELLQVIANADNRSMYDYDYVMQHKCFLNDSAMMVKVWDHMIDPIPDVGVLRRGCIQAV